MKYSRDKGDVGAVYLDGVEVTGDKYPISCRTGVRGYVVYYVLLVALTDGRLGGQFAEDGNGNLLQVKAKGRVQFFRKPKW